MTVEVTFAIRVENHTMHETEIDWDRVHTIEYLEGEVQIVSDAAKLTIEDDVEPIVQNFCLASLPEMVEHKAYEYKYFCMVGTIHMVLNENRILVSGDYIESVEFPARAFAEALFACAQRFDAFLHRLKRYVTAESMSNLGMPPDMMQAASSALDQLKAEEGSS